MQKENDFASLIQNARFLLDKINELILIIDKEGKIFFLNKAGNKILGYKKGELDDKDWFKRCLPISCRKEIKSIFNKVIRNPKNLINHYESLVITKNGEEKLIRWYNNILKDKQGKIFGILGSGEDITAKKKSEEKLQESKELIEKVFSSIKDAIFILDSKKPPLIIECNPAATEIFGYGKKDMVGKTTDILHIDKMMLLKFQKILYPIIQNHGYLTNFGFEMKRKNGEIFPSEHSVFPIKNESGKRTGWVSVVRDITEIETSKTKIEESENLFRSIFAGSPMGIMVFNVAGEIININKACCEMLKIKSKDVLGKNLFSLPFFTKESKPFIWNQMRKGKMIHSFSPINIKLFRKNGQSISVSMRAVQLRDKDGNVSRIVTMLEDISQQIETESELKKKLKELENFKEFAVGRELRMIELKKKLKKFEKQPKRKVEK